MSEVNLNMPINPNAAEILDAQKVLIELDKIQRSLNVLRAQWKHHKSRLQYPGMAEYEPNPETRMGHNW